MCVYPFIILVSCLFILGVLGPCEFLWRAGSYIFCVGLRCVECRAGTILFGHYPLVDGGTVQIFLFFGSVVAGTVRVKWWGGGLSFFSFSSVCCQLSWRAVVCGRIFVLLYRFVLFGYILVLFAVSYFTSC